MLLGTSTLALVAACASLVGLDDSDPASNGVASEEEAGTAGVGDGGVNGTGEITTEAGVSISPVVVEFQRAKCGTQQTKTITVKNDSDDPTKVDVSLPGNQIFSIMNADANGDLHLDIAPHQRATFTLQGNSTKPGTSSADVLVKLGEIQTHLSVSLDTVGGGLAFDPSEIDFGDIRQNLDSEEQQISFRNDGNDAIKVTGFTGGPNFKFPTDVQLDPGSSISQKFAMTGGPAGDPITETLTPTVSGEVCGDLPKLTLKGHRVNDEVTVNPNTVEFGSQPCSSTAINTTQTLTVSNYSTASTVDYKVELQAGTKFKITNGAIGMVPKASSPTTPGTTAITLGILDTGDVPGDLTENVNVTLTSLGRSVPIKVHTKVVGAVLQLGATSLSVRRNTMGSVSLTNKGNVRLCVKYKSSNSRFFSEEKGQCNYYYCTRDDTDDQLDINERDDWRVQYFGNGGESATISMEVISCGSGQPLAAVCGGLPTLSVTGTN